MTQYEIRFADLARHAIWLVPTKRERIKRFIDDLNYGLRYSLAREAETGVGFDQIVEIARRLEQVRRLEREDWEGKMPNGSGCFSGTSYGGQSHRNRGHPYRPTQITHQVSRSPLASHGSYKTHPL
ncbi:uncharacterized protein [Nicotiana tomentosiformis]|uniref:uncharacterized protein n=1 Tax=Nicotiana tomentosiformis TaxID=4098 RepID=UPI00388CEC77